MRWFRWLFWWATPGFIPVPWAQVKYKLIVPPVVTAFTVSGGQRYFNVASVDRSLAVPPAPRTFSVPAERRTFAVPD